MAGKKSRLSDLHARFTEALIAELEEAQSENIPLPAADKSVIVKFLKDNNITADADDVGMSRLREDFEDELEVQRQKRKKEILDSCENNELKGIL